MQVLVWAPATAIYFSVLKCCNFLCASHSTHVSQLKSSPICPDSLPLAAAQTNVSLLEPRVPAITLNVYRTYRNRLTCPSQQRVEWICGNKMPTRCNRGFIADLIACSTCFGHHYTHHPELKSIIQWLLPVVFRAVVFKLLVWCGAEGYVSGLQDAAALWGLN